VPKTPLHATTSVARITAAVTSAAGGAGAVISDSTDSTSVALINTGEYDVEYKIDSGAWVLLPDRATATLDLNLANSVLRTRKTAGSGDGAVALDITQLDNAFIAGDSAMNLVSLPINAQTGTSYTLVLTDAGKQVDMSNAGANTLNIPTNANEPFEIGTIIWVCMKGTGITTIAGAGVTLQKPAAKALAISAQYEMARLHKIATDTWRVNAT